MITGIYFDEQTRQFGIKDELKKVANSISNSHKKDITNARHVVDDVYADFRYGNGMDSKKALKMTKYVKNGGIALGTIGNAGVGAALGTGTGAIAFKLKAKKLGLKPGTPEYAALKKKYLRRGAGVGAGVGALSSIPGVIAVHKGYKTSMPGILDKMYKKNN